MLNAAHTTRQQTRALDTWRDAESLVASRWRVFLDARGANRARAFASYVAALDAEEAAAGEVALLSDLAA
jgi:hypothetical protein